MSLEIAWHPFEREMIMAMVIQKSTFTPNLFPFNPSQELKSSEVTVLLKATASMIIELFVGVKLIFLKFKTTISHVEITEDNMASDSSAI